MTMEGTRAQEEARIREMVADWAKAVRAKNVPGVMTHYAADIVTFDLAPPLQYTGADALKESLEAWFATWQGPLGYEIRDLRITTGGDAAFCRSLNRISGARMDGEETGVWVRATVGLRKIDGTWRVAHEHTSVPFYMDGSYRAAVDLAPQLRGDATAAKPEAILSVSRGEDHGSCRLQSNARGRGSGSDRELERSRSGQGR